MGEISVNQLELHKPHQAWYQIRDKKSISIKAPGELPNLGEVEVAVEWIDGTIYRNTKLHVEVIQARDLKAMDMGGVSDPYATIRLGRQERQTQYQRQTLSPVWNHSVCLDFTALEKLVVE